MILRTVMSYEFRKRLINTVFSTNYLCDLTIKFSDQTISKQ